MSKNKGWICPVCGKGLSPLTVECNCVEKSPLLEEFDKTAIDKSPAIPQWVVPPETKPEPRHIKIYTPEECPAHLKATFKLTAEVLCYVWVPNSVFVPNKENILWNVIEHHLLDSNWNSWQGLTNAQGSLYVYYRAIPESRGEV